MNWLDYVLIAVLAFSAARSFRRGFTREVISLGAAFAALILGMWFYGTAGSLVRRWVASDRAADLIGFLMVVIAVLFAGLVVGSIVRRFVRAVGLSFFDYLLGAVFGLIRGALIAIALLTAYIAFGPVPPSSDALSDSKAAPSAVVHSHIARFLLEASRIFVDVAPMELKRSFRREYDEVKREIRRLATPDENGAAKRDSGTK